MSVRTRRKYSMLPKPGPHFLKCKLIRSLPLTLFPFPSLSSLATLMLCFSSLPWLSSVKHIWTNPFSFSFCVSLRIQSWTNDSEGMGLCVLQRCALSGNGHSRRKTEVSPVKFILNWRRDTRLAETQFHSVSGTKAKPENCNQHMTKKRKDWPQYIETMVRVRKRNEQFLSVKNLRPCLFQNEDVSWWNLLSGVVHKLLLFYKRFTLLLVAICSFVFSRLEVYLETEIIFVKISVNLIIQNFAIIPSLYASVFH